MSNYVARVAPEWRWFWESKPVFVAPFWEGTGKARDLVTGTLGYDQADSGDLQWVRARKGPALYVPAADGGAKWDAHSQFSVASGDTFAIFSAFEYEANGTDYDHLFDWRGTSFLFNISFNGTIWRFDQVDPVLLDLRPTKAISNGYHSAAFTFEGAYAKAIVDGEVVGQDTGLEAGATDTGMSINIGARATWSDYEWKGSIYNSVLWIESQGSTLPTVAQMARLHEDPFGPFRMAKAIFTVVPTGYEALEEGPGEPAAGVSGSATSSETEDGIRYGTHQIVITLTDDTWITSGFDDQRQSIINGIDSDGSESYGWDAERSKIPVTAVVRTSDTVVTITLPALPDFNIAAAETLTVTIPAAALVTSTDPLGATPTFDIDPVLSYIERIPRDIDWTPNSGYGTKILSPGEFDVDWDGFQHPPWSVIDFGGKKILYYGGALNDTSPDFRAIGAALSYDGGYTWTKYGSNPVIEYNPSGPSYPEEGAVSAVPLVEGSTVHMWYSGTIDVGGGGVDMRIRYCNSTDGLSFSNHSNVLVTSGNEYWAQSAIKLGSTYYLYYTITQGAPGAGSGRGPLYVISGTNPATLGGPTEILAAANSHARIVDLDDTYFAMDLSTNESTQAGMWKWYYFNKADPTTILGPLTDKNSDFDYDVARMGHAYMYDETTNFWKMIHMEYWSSGYINDGLYLHTAFIPFLEGYRFRLDDGSESGATWAANQDTSYSMTASGIIRLRLVVEALKAGQYQLEVAQSGTNNWYRIV